MSSPPADYVRRRNRARGPNRLPRGLATGWIATLALAGLVGQAPTASAQAGQIVEFEIGPGFIGPLPLGQTPLAGQVALGVADVGQTGGLLEATLYDGEGFAFKEAETPGFAIFDRTILVDSTLDPAAGRYQIQFGVRALRAELRHFDDFARARFVHYDRAPAGGVRFARVRADLRETLVRARALEPRSGRVRFERFARRLRVMRYDKVGARWLPAFERVGERFIPIERFGRRATFTPGHYGFDPQNQLVWSTQDADGAYALGFPVPEPHLLSLLGPGLAALGVAAAARRRRRARAS